MQITEVLQLFDYRVVSGEYEPYPDLYQYTLSKNDKLAQVWFDPKSLQVTLRTL